MSESVLVYAPEGPPPRDRLIRTEILWRHGAYRWQIYMHNGTLWAVAYKPGAARGSMWFKCIPKEEWLETQR